MTKSEVSPNEQTPGGPPPAERQGTGDSPRAGTVPLPELVEQFRQFEARVDEAVRLIGELRRQKRALEARLDEEKQARAEAVRRIDAILEKVDELS